MQSSCSCHKIHEDPWIMTYADDSGVKSGRAPPGTRKGAPDQERPSAEGVQLAGSFTVICLVSGLASCAAQAPVEKASG
ncbi:hypothetical protein GCM10020216_055380 [Nonomuraea helvata]